ncbi:HoxN/HupN/NixA family nickel/cobalt transporter [Nonomuraea sp. NPDC048901]|uniref:HoxN/HupN/NixA family nickel/cobalt transporter n=1 Tax=Nonomuraea sp. NPDC048901 TaxID=3155627 RepID=UPI0033EFA298
MQTSSRRFTRTDVLRLIPLLGVVAALHVAGFGLFAYYNAQPAYHNLTDGRGQLVFASAAGIVYLLGMRHAFDADHIAAIDDTTRLLLQKGRPSQGVGLFFSLGHSTVVLALSVAVAFATQAAVRFQSSFADIGGIIGTTVSGAFLYLVAGLNLVIFAGIWKMWRQVRQGAYEPERLERLLAERGLLNRLLKGRYTRLISAGWHIYPVGLLFGLGFDTATQVGLIGVSAGAAAGGQLPPLAIISLPLIFAAGMSLWDTLDGAFMAHAYNWAFSNPLRKIYYNLSTTGLSIFVAFAVGTVELLGILADQLGLADRQPWAALAAIDLNTIGYGIVGVFLLTWLGSIAYWKLAKLEQRYAQPVTAEADLR